MDNQIQQNHPKKRKWFLWIIGIIFFFVIVSIFSDTNTNVNTNTNNDTFSSVSNNNNSIEKVGNPELKEEVIPEPALIELSGMGQQASQKFTLENGLSIFNMAHDGTSNFSIVLMNSDGQRIELLVNEIGKFNGAKAIGIVERGEYVLDVSASGKWTVKIEQLRPTIADAKPRTFTGIGQQVSPFVKLDKGLTTFKLKHTGESNFAVLLIDKNGNREELLVNEIGDFDGSKAVGISKSDLYLLDISADGEWLITIE